MEDLNMRVAAHRDLTPHIREFTLVPEDDGATLASFDPGSHITLETPSGAMRRYSLVNEGENPKEYVIAVKREADSRGGSASMHDDVTEGTVMRVEPPENDFPLSDAPEYLLIAGGIGITPIYAMAHHLKKEGKSFNIIYCTRTREDTAYHDELTETFGDRITIHHDNGDEDEVFDFWDIFEEPKKMNVYCCGPEPLMEEIESISGHWPEGRVNFEDFKPVEVVREDDTAFEVELRKSGKTVSVPADRSVLEALREAGVHTVSSCESGTCGTCKTRLIDGAVDHRDMVLMDEERSDHIMICVSRAKEGALVLDL